LIVPPDDGTTVAVKVTDCPKLDGFNEETKVVVVVVMTTCFNAFDVLLPKLPSLLYCAVTLSVPAGRVETDMLVVPPVSIPVPRMVEPCLKETVSPSGGTPNREATVEKSTTAWPKLDGFGRDVRVVVVAARATVWESVLEVLLVKVLSPP